MKTKVNNVQKRLYGVKKSYRLMALALCIMISAWSCSRDEGSEVLPSSEIKPLQIDLSDVNWDLDIDFRVSNVEFPKEEINDIFIRELGEYIFESNESDELRSYEFKIRYTKDKVLINYPNYPIPSNIYAAAAPCPTQRKRCTSRKQVEKALHKIMGDGKRDVDIKFRRHTLCVTIEYTYQDC